MDVAEEEAHADAAARAGTVLIIDETTADLAIDVIPGAAAVPAEVSFSHTPVVRIGSLGKTVWGGLRIGWVRADRELVSLLIAARPARDLGTPEFEQAVAARVVERMPDVLAQRAQLLGEGRDATVRALRERLPNWRVPDVAGGVALWIELDAPLSSGLVLAARNEGVYLSAGSRFAVDGGYDRHLRLPFTAPVRDLRRAVGVLAELWPDVRAAAPVDVGDYLEALI